LKLLYHHRTRAVGAEGRHIRGIVEGFEHRGWKVIVLSPPGVGLATSAAAGPTASPSRIWDLITDRMPDITFEALEILYNFNLLWNLRRELNRNRPLAIYERYAVFTWATTWMARYRKLPIVLEINYTTTAGRARPLQARRLAVWIEGWIFRNATHLVTITEDFKQRIISQHHIAPERIKVLPNAVDRSLVLNDGGQAEPPTRFTLGMVGAFLPWHGLEFAVKTLAAFLKDKNSKLLLVGDGPERTRLEQWIDELQLHRFVELTGFMPATRVPHYLTQMDVALIADSAEHASPIKMFEYMATGKAVIAPARASIQQIITHEFDGLIFETLNPSALLAAVERLYRDAELRKRLGSNARQTVLSKHLWEHRVQEIESWFLDSKN
jgi:glycosyltransferase involved in cell wall biosynthesis